MLLLHCVEAGSRLPFPTSMQDAVALSQASCCCIDLPHNRSPFRLFQATAQSVRHLKIFASRRKARLGRAMPLPRRLLLLSTIQLGPEQRHHHQPGREFPSLARQAAHIAAGVIALDAPLLAKHAPRIARMGSIFAPGAVVRRLNRCLRTLSPSSSASRPATARRQRVSIDHRAPPVFRDVGLIAKLPAARPARMRSRHRDGRHPQ